MNAMYHPKLPLKFILLWVINLVLLLAVSFATGLKDALFNMRINGKNLAYLYLGVGAVLALLEQALWDKLRGNE